MLENQLQVYSKSITEDELRKQLVAFFEEKHKKEIIAKVSIHVYTCTLFIFIFLFFFRKQYRKCFKRRLALHLNCLNFK